MDAARGPGTMDPESEKAWGPMLRWSICLAAFLALLALGSWVAHRKWLYGHRIPSVLRACSPPEGSPAEEGIAELGGRERARRLLREYLRVTSPDVTDTVQAYYLLSFCDESVVPDLIAMLGDMGTGSRTTKHSAMIAKCKRMYAADALAQIGPRAENAVPGLIKALDDPEYSVRYRAARALGRMGPAAKTAVPRLTSIIADDQVFGTTTGSSRDAMLLMCCIMTLGKLGPAAKESAPGVMKWSGDADPGVRGCVAEALGMMGPTASDAAPCLREMLRDKDDRVRDNAAKALQRIGSNARSDGG